MNSFYSGIYNYYNTSGGVFHSMTSGQFAYENAPQVWSDNYAVIKHVVTMPDETFDSLDIHDIHFRINVFSKDRSTCGDLNAECIKLFNGENITVTGSYDCKIIRGNSSPLMLTAGGILWSMATDFKTKLQET